MRTNKQNVEQFAKLEHEESSTSTTKVSEHNDNICKSVPRRRCACDVDQQAAAFVRIVRLRTDTLPASVLHFLSEQSLLFGFLVCVSKLGSRNLQKIQHVHSRSCDTPLTAQVLLERHCY